MSSRPGSDHMQYRLALLFIILAFCIVSAGYLYYSAQERHIKKNVQDELSAIADLKVDQITSWRKERIGNATVISKNAFTALAVRRFLEHPDARELRQGLLDLMKSRGETYDYKIIRLVDARGDIRISTIKDDRSLGPQARKTLVDAFNAKQAVLSDIHSEPSTTGLHFDLVAPFFLPGQSSVPIGAIMFEIDPQSFLYPLIQSWPGLSDTGEMLLFRREGNDLVFLNELRYRKGTSLVMRLPLDMKQLPAAMAIKGQRGVFEGIDYRDVPVLAASRAVPQTTWFLIAKMDIGEIYAPIRKQAWQISIVIILLIAATSLSIVFWWRKKTAEFDRKQYETELARKVLSQRYDYLSKYANDIILLGDPEGNIVEANDRAIAVYGYTRDELLRLNIRDLRSSENQQEIREHMQQIQEHNGFIFESVHLRKNGVAFPVEVSSRLIDSDGESFFQSIIRDTTERKQAEQALMESEQRYKRLVKSVTDYIVTIDVENGRAVATHHGPGCVTVTGYTSDEYHADPELWSRMIFDGDRDAVIEQMNAVLSGAQVAPFEHRIIHKDGSLRWVRHTPVPRTDGKGRVITVDGLITDITPLKLLENQLRQAQKMEAVGQLAGGIAHDFNNILTAIIGYSHLLLMKMKADNSGRSYVEQIISSSERAAHLTHSLLAFSRKQLIDLKPVDLNNIIRRVEHLLGRVISEDIEFKTLLAEENLPVLADSIQIEQVLMNLAANARDAMPHGGTLLIETRAVVLGEDFVRTHSYGRPGRYAYLSVMDTGIGMDENTRRRIFEPFFTTKEVGKGTGLGLSMVYGIIKQHQGYINVFSNPGKGATFTIYLPLLATSTVEEPASAPAKTARGTETVLLAEDDKTVRDLTRYVLEGSGYQVIEAADGEEAVQRFFDDRKRIDLLLIDIIMPKKNGKEAYLEIKQIRQDIKVLFMSGYTAHTMNKNGVREAGLDFVMKPISPSDLLKKVREILDRKS